MSDLDKPSTLIWTIPQIQEAIFHRGGLARRDLAKASRVCRMWSLIISPFLWEHFMLGQEAIDSSDDDGDNDENEDKKSMQNSARAGVLAHGRWIRTLNTYRTKALEWLVESDQGGARLVEINIGLQSDFVGDTHPVNILLPRANQLRVFRCLANTRYDRDFSSVVEGLMKLSPGYLTDLQLDWMIVGNDLSRVLNQHWETISCLRLVDCQLSGDALKELKLLRNLKMLALAIIDCGNQNQREFEEGLLGLLSAAPRLLELDLDMDDLVWNQPLLTALDAGSLALLEGLRVVVDPVAEPEDNGLVHLLSALPRSLSRLKLEGWSMGPSESIAVSNLKIFDRLTVIHFSQCGKVGSEVWQTLLMNCRFLVEILDNRMSFLDVTDMTEQWVCVNLEYFGLDVQVFRGSLETFTTEVVLQNCEKIFGQLAALQQLKKLKMDLIVDKPNGWQATWPEERKVTDRMQERFMSLWSRLGACNKMQYIEIKGDLWILTLDNGKLRTLSEEIWGKQVRAIFRLWGMLSQ